MNNNYPKIKYFDLYGLREEKYEFLKTHDVKNTEWRELELKEPHFWFVPKDFESEGKYNYFISMADIFIWSSCGVKTHRDDFILGYSKESLERKLSMFSNKTYDNEFIRSTFDLKDTKTWKLENSRKSFIERGINEELFRQYSYRPFDDRWIYYDNNLIERARMKSIWDLGPNNLAIITTRQLSTSFFRHTFITQFAPDICSVSLQTKESAYIFPLFMYHESKENTLIHESETKQTNFSPEFWSKVKDTFIEMTDPWSIFYCIYAVLHSNTYRKKYNEFLKIDFPKIPFAKDREIFFKMSKLGKELANLHLLKSEKLENPIAIFPIAGDSRVRKREYNEKEKRIYINDKQYFEGVEPEVWNYYIGGYQVLDKWLKDRIGRILSPEDTSHYLKVITALKYTIVLQKEIDKIYPEVEKELLTF